MDWMVLGKESAVIPWVRDVLGVHEYLLAALKFALLPVGWGVNLFAGVPNLTGGAGPVFCGCNGAAAGGCSCGIGGIGGTGGAGWPNPDLEYPLRPVCWGCNAGGNIELIPVACG